MKLEAGKYYRTRSGMKAFVGAICPYECHPFQKVVGWIGGSCFTWAMSGQWGSGSNNPDLVAEWVDPPTTLEALKAIRATYKQPVNAYTPEWAKMLSDADAAIAAAEAK